MKPEKCWRCCKSFGANHLAKILHVVSIYKVYLILLSVKHMCVLNHCLKVCFFIISFSGSLSLVRPFYTSTFQASHKTLSGEKGSWVDGVQQSHERLATPASSFIWWLRSTQEGGLSSLPLRVECPHTVATYINVVFRNKEHSTSTSAKTHPFKKNRIWRERFQWKQNGSSL